MDNPLKTIAITILVLVVVVGILLVWESFSGARTSSSSRASWQLPSIPTWAWWVVAGIVCLSALYFLIPWLKGLFGPSEGTTSTILGWFEGNLGIMAVIVITIGLVVVRSRGYTGGGMVTTAIVIMSIVIGIWFLLGERAPVAFSQLRAKAVSTILDDTDDSKEAGPPMAKVEWPGEAYNGDLTIKPHVWSKTLLFQPDCGVKQNIHTYGKIYVAEYLTQNGQELKWVAPENGPTLTNVQGMRFMLLVPGEKVLKVLYVCGKKAWME